MKHSITLLFAFATIALFSCQKEVSPENIVTNPPAGLLDSNYLYRIYYIDSIAGVKDTISFYAYQYDNLKRVTSLTDSVKSGFGLVPYPAQKYFYNGNDTLPFKSEEYRIDEFDNALNDTTVNFHFYNSSGNINYDSSIISYRYNGPSGAAHEVEKLIAKYQYSGNNIYRERAFTTLVSENPPPYFPSVDRDSAVVDMNGNVLSSKRYDVDVMGSNLILTSSFTYDNKPSPFARLSNFRTLSVLPFGETFIEEMQNKNNRLKATEIGTIAGTYIEDLSGKYSYNTSGYPTRIVHEDTFNPGTYTIISFVYRSL